MLNKSKLISVNSRCPNSQTSQMINKSRAKNTEYSKSKVLQKRNM